MVSKYIILIIFNHLVYIINIQPIQSTFQNCIKINVCKIFN